MGGIVYRLLAWARTRWRVGAALGVLAAVLVAGSLVLMAGAARTLSAPDRFTAAQESSFDVTIEQGGGAPRDSEVQGLSAVERVYAATFVFGGLLGESGEPLDVLVFAGDVEPTRSRVVDGRRPRVPTEFIASRSFLVANGLELGDELQLVTLTADQAASSGFDVETPEGPQLTATVVGAMDGPGELEGDVGVAMFPASLLDEGDMGVSATVMAVGLTDGTTLSDLRGELDELPDGADLGLEPADWVSDDIRAAVNAQGQGILIVAGIVGLASLVVLGQLIGRQLRSSRDELSTLKTLGYSKRQSIIEPAARAVLVLVPAVVVAAVLAFVFSSTFPRGFVTRIEPDPGRRFDPFVLIAGGALVVVAVSVWAAVSMALEQRPRPHAADLAIGERAASRIADPRVATAVRFAFGSAEAGLRPRGGLTGMVVVVAGVFGAVTFGASLDRLLSEPERYGVDFDVGIGAGGEISDEIVDALHASDDVEAFTLYATTAVSVGTESIDVVGIRPERGDLVPRVVRGRLPLVEDEIAVGPKTASSLDLVPGDTLDVGAASGRRALRVTGVVVAPPVNGADVLGEVALVSDEGMAALDPDVGFTFAGIDLEGGPTQAAIRRLGELTQSAVGPLSPATGLVNIQRVRAMPFFVAGTMAALALLSLAHVLIVSVRRRRVEHAMLRALGATPRWIGTVVFWQATVITVVVALVAVPLGLAVGSFAYRQLSTAIGVVDVATVSLLVLVAVVVPTVVLANVVAAVPARRSRRARPAELLRAVS